MLWINYLDMGSERVHTSLEGSFRLVGWRGRRDDTRKRHCLVSRRGKKTRSYRSFTCNSFPPFNENSFGWSRKEKKKKNLSQILSHLEAARSHRRLQLVSTEELSEANYLNHGHLYFSYSFTYPFPLPETL